MNKKIRMKFCNSNCEYFVFPIKESNMDGCKTCRTFVAAFCKKLDRIVYKNGPCEIYYKRDLIKEENRVIEDKIKKYNEPGSFVLRLSQHRSK